MNKLGAFDERDWWDEDKSVCEVSDVRVHSWKSSSGSCMGPGGGIVSESGSYSAFRVSDNEDVDLRLGNVSVVVEAGMGPGGITAGYSASLDVVNARLGPGRARVGLDGSSGITIGAGVEVKAAGFGFSVGKKMGISTPLGEVYVDADDCVSQ